MTMKVDDDKLSNLRTEVYCTLISTKEGLTLKNFLRDYKEQNGKPFPYAAFGFKTPLEYMKSIPDVVSIVNDPKTSEILLMPVETESSKSAHINKFILGQKPAKRAFGRPRPVQLPTDSRRPLLPNPTDRARPILQPSRSMRRWENKNSFPPRNMEASNIQSTRQYSWFGMKQTMTMSSSIPLYPEHMTPLNQVNTFFQPDFQKHLSQHQSEIEDVKMQCPNKQLENIRSVENESTLERNGGQRNIQSCSEEHKEEATIVDVKEANITNSNYFSSEENIKYEDNLSESSDIIDYGMHGDDIEECSIQVSDKMKINFRMILSEHPNGILASKFPLDYQKKFGVPLNHSELGVHSVKELVAACPDIFKIYKTKNQQDWLLFDTSSKVISPDDTSKWIPRQVLENMEELSHRYHKGIESEDVVTAYKELFQAPLDFKKLGFESLTSFLVNCQSIECKTEDDKCFVFPVNWGNKETESPEVDDSFPDPFLSLENTHFLWKQYFNENVCDPTFKFEKFLLPNDKNLKVLVSDAISPDFIWLQNASTGHLLTELMFELNNFYDEEEEKYKMNENMLVPGLACCVKYNPVNRWHRAIMHHPSESEVKVLFIDYGTTEFVKIEELRTLHKKFSTLPIQAIKAKLYDVIPANEKGWSEEAIECFYEMCLEKVFIAEIVNIKPEIPMIEVVLCDTKGPEDIIINEKLIMKQFALSSSKASERFVQGQGSCMNASISTNCHQDSRKALKSSTFNCNSSEENGLNIPPVLSYPECFMKIFPTWLNVTKEWTLINQTLDEAKSTYMKEASLSKTAECNRRIPPPSCCYHHLLSNLFVNKPRVFCEVWAKTIESLSTSIENILIRNLSSELGLPLNLKNYPFYCAEENNCNNNLPNFQVKLENNIIIDDHKFSLPSKVKDTENVADSQIMLEKNSKKVYSECSGSSDDESIDNKEYKNNYTKKRVLRSVIQAKIGSKSLHFIRYKNKVYVIMDQLLKTFARSVSTSLVKHRLLTKRMSINSELISSKQKLLHQELVMHNIIKTHESVSLVPLVLAGDILSTVDPLLTSVPDMLREMANKCTADHPYWYE